MPVAIRNTLATIQPSLISAIICKCHRLLLSFFT